MLVRYVHGIIFLYLEILVWTQEDKGDAGGESVIIHSSGVVSFVLRLWGVLSFLKGKAYANREE